MGISVFHFNQQTFVHRKNTICAVFYKFYTSKKTSQWVVIALFSHGYALSF